MKKNWIWVIAVSVLAVALASGCYDSGNTDGEIDTGQMGDGDAFISDVTWEVHGDVRTMVVVTWTQEVEAEEVFVAFTFENEVYYESHKNPGTTGEKQDLVIGVPEATEFDFHVVSQNGDTQAWSNPHTAQNLTAPGGMPRPTVESYDETLASPNRWLFGSVDDTLDTDDYYGGPFYLYIIDRQGRIVWYFVDMGDNPIIGFPRISRDERYVFFANRSPWGGGDGFEPKVTKMTLDHEYYEEVLVPLADNADMTDDGSILYNTSEQGYSSVWLMEKTASGQDRYIWDCTAEFGQGSENCYTNTINWNPLSDSVVLSFPYARTVVEIDRASGNIVGQYGSKPGSYDFNPDTWVFGFQHFANITPEGTLMVSSHMPNSGIRHGFLEFDIDHANEVITEKWVYETESYWAEYMGEAHRVENGKGNVLGNYGTGGQILEITPNKDIAWQVKFDAPFTSDRYNKMVGHSTLIDDLYNLVRGPQ